MTQPETIVDMRFLTVTLPTNCRACIHLERVFRFHEVGGKAVFVYDDGSYLYTEDDFENLAMKLGAELLPPAVPREQMALAQSWTRAWEIPS